jgi:hypothetical protein
MTKRQDLEKEWLVVAELRLERLEEIRELLSISPDADADEAVGIMKWWRETGDVPISAKLKSQGDRILREFHRLDEMKLKILADLEF